MYLIVLITKQTVYVQV